MSIKVFIIGEQGQPPLGLGLWPSFTEWIFNSKSMSQRSWQGTVRVWVTEMEVIELEGFVLNHQMRLPGFER